MADDPYEEWRLPWRGAAAVAIGGAVLLAGALIGVSRIYDADLRQKVQVRRQEYPAPRLERSHEEIGPRQPADPDAVRRAMAEEARAGWAAR